MNKRRSMRQYRAVDLALWSLMLLIFESVIFLASTRWFPSQPYTVSLVPAISAIVLVRWGGWAALPALLGGFLICLLSRASLFQFAIYMAGNLAVLLLCPALRRLREEGTFRSSLQTLCFGAALLLLMQAGRAMLTLIFGASLPLALGCFTTEAITDLFTLIILWIARRLDGVLEDQRCYLRRLQAEEQTNF